MGTIEPASMLLLLAAVATIVVTLIVIYSRKKRQAQSTTKKMRSEMGEAQRKIENTSHHKQKELQIVEEERNLLEKEARWSAERREVIREDAEQKVFYKADDEVSQHFTTEQPELQKELPKREGEHLRSGEEGKHLEEDVCVQPEKVQRKAEADGLLRAGEIQKFEEAGTVEKAHRDFEWKTRRKDGEVGREVDESESFTVEGQIKRVEPFKRGGRSRDSIQDDGKQPSQDTKPRLPKPEIVCWKRERQWILGVEVPEELLRSSGLVVLQNTSPLSQDEYREGCWHLDQGFGEVMIRWNEDEDARESKISLSKENYLLFKLTGQNQSQGRRVKSPSSGSHIVIVPETWDRDEVLSGPPPVAPEFVSISEHRAHFFILEKNGSGKIAFRIPDGKLVVVVPKASRFELVGNRLNDASEDMGHLFGERPPQIHAPNDNAWNDVGTIVVGEEGGRQGKWRIAFRPVLGLTEQDLPSEVAARKCGWYFLRFYDTSDDLIDSLDFRFISVLKNIGVAQPPPFPPEGGHKPVRVEFHHDRICAIQPADSISCSIQIEREDDKTILTIPPDSTCDQTSWLVGPQAGPQVKITVLVERLWWAVGEEDNEPSKWENQILTLSRDDFIATSIKAFWLRLPRRGWTNEVFVGFQQSKLRPYTVMVTAKTKAVPLRDFGDSQELQDPGIVSFDSCISPQGAIYSSTVCQLIVKVGCSFCDFVAPKEQDVFSHVKSLHLDEFFRLLNYEEMRDQIPSLPPAIYKCSYCDFYIKSDNPTNPTSAIIKHIDNECEKVPHAGPIPIRFRGIDDMDEIRENVFRDLLRIHKCTRCGIYLNEATHNQADMVRHLIETHQHALYELR